MVDIIIAGIGHGFVQNINKGCLAPEGIGEIVLKEKTGPGMTVVALCSAATNALSQIRSISFITDGLCRKISEVLGYKRFVIDYIRLFRNGQKIQAMIFARETEKSRIQEIPCPLTIAFCMAVVNFASLKADDDFFH